MNTDEYIKHIRQSKNKNIKVLKPMVKKNCGRNKELS